MRTLNDVMTALEELGDEIRSMRTITRCRMIDDRRVQCTGEVLDATADVLICAKHAAQVMSLVNARMARRAS